MARSSVAAFAGLLTVLACSPGAKRIDDAALVSADADTANWITNGRTYSEQRHSPLSQINESTVGKLGLAWSLEMNTLRALEATPLVSDGVMYVTGAWSVLYAVDARTGDLLWTYDPKVPREHAKLACCDVVNRGAALYAGRVYIGTLDGRLIAVDGKSGSLVWETQTTPAGQSYTITGAPRIVKGKVLIGNGGGEYGVRGFVGAYDAGTGQLAWRTYLVPGDPSKPFESEAMRKAAATWSGEWWKAGGGGTAWDAVVYDPALDLVFVGTGNGSPWFRKLRSKGTGDNLYLSSIVALRASDGEMVWHYQTTPGDNWDYTATQPLMLADLTIDGKARRVIMQAPKNGFFYVLDRETGAFISAKAFGVVTWASGVDSTGRPVVNDAAMRLDDAMIVSPGPWGAHNWYPMSFNPQTGLVYFAVGNAPYLYAADPGWSYAASDMNVGDDARYAGPKLAQWLRMPVEGHLVAWDPVAQREVWRAESPSFNNGGTLSTSGNLVFQGRADGKFRAYRATDGRVLWEFDAGTGIAAAPISYAVGGTQYVALLAGLGGPDVLFNGATNKGAHVGPGRLLVFAVGSSGSLPAWQPPSRSAPTPAVTVRASSADIAEGGVHFYNYCARCHGVNVESGGSVPDLRYAIKATHDSLDSIVLRGARRQLGMPSFEKELTPEKVKQLQAYILFRAAESAKAAAATKH